MFSYLTMSLKAILIYYSNDSLKHSSTNDIIVKWRVSFSFCHLHQLVCIKSDCPGLSTTSGDMRLSISVMGDIPGTVGDLHPRALTLPATTPWSRAVTGAQPAEAGSHSSAICVCTGCPWRPRTKAPIHSEVSGLEGKHKQWCQKGWSCKKKK